MIYDDLKNDFTDFLKNYAIWIAAALVAVIVIVIVLILFLNKTRKKKEPEIAKKSEWIDALGGEDNIVSSEAYGSRLSLTLVDKTKINREKLTTLGVTSVIEMSEKITLLLEDKAERVKAEIDK